MHRHGGARQCISVEIWNHRIAQISAAASSRQTPRPRSRQTLRWCATAAAAPSAPAAPEDELLALLTLRSAAPKRYVGPVIAERIPGKRFGLLVRENVPAGTLLLVVPPLAVAFGPAGCPPANDALVSVLADTVLQPWQCAWLSLLQRQEDPPHRETTQHQELQQQHQELQQQQQQQQQAMSHAPQAPSDSGGVQTELDEAAQLGLLQALMQQGDAWSPAALVEQEQKEDDAGSMAATAASGIAAAAAAAAKTANAARVQQQQQQLDRAALASIVAANAYAEPCEDMGAALLRELEPSSVLGLWPELALVNHDCAPSCVPAVVGRYLLLRAARPLLAGDEVTVSYLGDACLSPVAARRAWLCGVQGFHCSCARCLTEQATFPTTYFAADDAALGLAGSGSGSTAAAADDGGGGAGIRAPASSSGRGWRVLPAPFAAAANALLLALRRARGSAPGPAAAAPAPAAAPNAAQHALLAALHTEGGELIAAARAAAVADVRRGERLLALLARAEERLAALAEAADDASAQLDARAPSPAAGRAWLLAASYPLLAARLELLELLLASSELPLDGRLLLLQEQQQGGSSSSSSSSASSSASSALPGSALGAAPATRALAAAGGAAAVRFAHNSRRGGGARSSSGSSGQTWLARLFGSSGSHDRDSSAPLTKRTLLSLRANALADALAAVEAVSRGSELHLELALRGLDAARALHGRDSQEAALAEAAAGRAHAARYGPLSSAALHHGGSGGGRGGGGAATLAALVAARQRRLLGSSLARKMGVLAWEAASLAPPDRRRPT